MKRHQRTFFGQKVGIIFDSSDWDNDCAYITFVKKKNETLWEKPSQGEGKTIKLNLGELICIQQIITGKNQKWSTVHKFGENSTSISVNKNPDTKDVWISINGYSKNLRSPEIEILALILNHIIKEKIEYATGYIPKTPETKINA